MKEPKYIRGERIHTIQEFTEATDNHSALWYEPSHRYKHPSIFIGMPFRTVLNMIRQGFIYYAKLNPNHGKDIEAK